METKPYPQYKESGIQWIGKIPEEWSSHKIKDYLEFDIGGTPPTSHEEYFEGDNVWISIEDLTTNKTIDIKNSKKKISDEAIKKSNVKLIKKGSLLFSFKLTVGETAFAGCDLYTNEAIAAFKQNKNISLNYLKYLLKVGFENNAFENIYGAKIFNSELIKFAKIIKPSFIEQEQIAKYLDNKTTKIQKTITKNKQLITLLKEKRTTLINQTVTKGLNPDVQMKESGIEWIGEIPVHWKIYKLKHVIDEFISGGTPQTDNDLFWSNENSGIPWVSIGDMNNKPIENTKKEITELGLHEKSLKILKKGTLLYSIFASLGKVSILNIDATTNQAILGLIHNLKVNKIYLKYYLIFIEDKLTLFSNSNTQNNLNTTLVKNMPITLPSKEEQKQIADYLDKETSKIDKTIEKIEKEIELLKEYKKSLIYHVVTGKIDVRGVDV